MADKPTVPSFAANSTFQAAKANELADDLATAIEGCLGRGGTGESPNSMTGNLDMDLYKIQNLGVPSSDNDAVRLVDLSDSDATGSASAQLRADLLSESDNYGVDLVGNATRRVDTYAELVALTSQDANDIIILGGGVSVGDGGGGILRWDSSDLSTEVTADTLSGIYVAPSADTTGASGAWVRQHDGTINALWFGAVGDGITEDADALQAWLTAAEGKIAYLPPGQYKVVDGITTDADDTHIRGYGAEILYTATETYYHCIRMQGSNISIHGVTISCDSGLVRDDTGFAISLGLDTTKSYNATVRDCRFNDIASASVWVTNVDHVKLENNYVYRSKADGLHCSDGCYYPTIKNNFVYYPGDDAIAIVNDVAGVPYVGSFLISGNVVLGGTYVAPHGSHGVSLVGAMRGIVSNNFIQGTLSPGIGLWKWTGPTQESEDISITGNRLVNCATEVGLGDLGVGIDIGYAASVSITDNVITNMQYDAGADTGCILVADGAAVSIRSNNLYDNSTYGVRATAGNTLSIVGNAFGFSTITPIQVDGTAVNCSVVGNTFNDNTSTYDIDVTVTSELVVTGNASQKAMNISGGVEYIESMAVYTTTPTVTSTVGTITTVSAVFNYKYNGDFIDFNGTITITDNGTGSGTLLLPMPVTAAKASGGGREVSVTNKAVAMDATSSASLRIANYDGTYPGVTGGHTTFFGRLSLTK